jgi:flagellar biosynthesis GTPase FlhF
MYKIKLFFGLMGLGLIVACSEKATNSKVENVVKAFVDPPIKELQTPFESYQVDAKLGDTLIYPSGTVIVFPQNAFTDSNGNVVEGPVEVKYREFKDAVDFYLSGIPMNYTPPGSDKEAIFESAGMCELVAYRRGEQLQVNPSAKPELMMSSTDDAPDYNVYYLDTISKKWIEKGKDEIIDLNEFEKEEEVLVSETVSYTSPPSEPLPLLEPRRANPDMPKFEIEIDPSALPELRAYHGMFFELHESEKNYNPNDANEDYEDLKIERGKYAGTYEVTFSRIGKEVSYQTRPVLEGKDYDEALKVFKAKQKEFELAQDRRIKEEKQKEKEAILAQRKLEKEREEAQVRAEREEQAESRAELKAESDRKKEELKWSRQQEEINRVSARNSAREMKAALVQQQRDLLAQSRTQPRSVARTNSVSYIAGKVDGNSLVRTFTLDGFGIWNCDRPMYLAERGGVYVNARFMDQEGNSVPLNSVSSAYLEFNVVASFGKLQGSDSPINLVAASGGRQVIWGLVGNDFYYATEGDIQKAQLSKNIANAEIKLRRLSDKATSSEDIKKALGFSKKNWASVNP